MSWGYSGSVKSITPSLTEDNWTLDASVSGIGRLKEVSWSGESISSVAMQTRVARGNAEVTEVTAVTAFKHSGADTPANKILLISEYTTEPTLDAGDIVAESWNSHGGLFRWTSDPEDEVWLITGMTLDLISCRNTVGVGVSTYSVSWNEISSP